LEYIFIRIAFIDEVLYWAILPMSVIVVIITVAGYLTYRFWKSKRIPRVKVK